MRLPIISLAATFCLISPIFAAPPSGQTPANVEEDVLGIPKKPSIPEKAGSAESASSADTPDGSTTFNGITVPPLKEVKGDAFDDEIEDGYWYADSDSCAYPKDDLQSPLHMLHASLVKS